MLRGKCVLAVINERTSNDLHNHLGMQKETHLVNFPIEYSSAENK